MTEGKWRVTTDGTRFLLGIMEIAKPYCGDGCTTLWLHYKHWCVPLKWVNAMVCAVYISKAIRKMCMASHRLSNICIKPTTLKTVMKTNHTNKLAGENTIEEVEEKFKLKTLVSLERWIRKYPSQYFHNTPSSCE